MRKQLFIGAFVVLMTACTPADITMTCTSLVEQNSQQWTESYTITYRNDDVTSYKKEVIKDFAYLIKGDFGAEDIKPMLEETKSIYDTFKGTVYQYTLQDTLAHQVLLVEYKNLDLSRVPTSEILVDVDQLPTEATRSIEALKSQGFTCKMP